MRRTIRKTFLLEGETVTMKYVKKLCGEERYSRMLEDAKNLIRPIDEIPEQEDKQ